MASQDRRPARHYVMAAYSAWGHARPLCTLASRIVTFESEPVIVTICTTTRVYDRVVAEVSRGFQPDEDKLRARVRVVALDVPPHLFADLGIFDRYFAEAYQTMVACQPVVCAKTNVSISMDCSPDVAIFDFFANDSALAVRQYSKKDVKLVCSVPMGLFTTSFLFGPAGGHGAHSRGIIEEKMKSSGRDIVEVADEHFIGCSGKLTQIPGIPPMYDYEHFPQKFMLDIHPGVHILATLEFLGNCDTLLAHSALDVEPVESVELFKQWFADTSPNPNKPRHAYMVGPMTPFKQSTSIAGDSSSPNALEIEEFVGRVYQSHGPQSMLYVCFGSFFWSAEPERIWAFVDALLEKKRPFLFSHPSPVAKVPDSVAEKVKASGIGLLTPWAPQQAILAHPVTGWFVSHCGWNSAMESLSAGVPIICWPFNGDQPLDAVQITDNLQVGYELLEVRNGIGLQPICRSGRKLVGTLEAIREETSKVLDLAFGPDGAKKRENALRLKESIDTLWKEGGASRVAFEGFLKDVST